MARISRTRYIPFGDTGIVDDFGQFGSKTAGVELKTKSLAQIQALAAWTAGFKAALRAGNRVVYMEDLNALEYVTGQMLGYILQEGIPEWEGNSTYHQNSIVKKPGTYELYASLVNDNTGNVLPSQTDDVNWSFISPVRFSTLIGQAVDAQIAGMSASKLIGALGADLPAASHKITGLANGTSAGDAINLSQLKAILLGSAGGAYTVGGIYTSIRSLGSLSYNGDPVVFLGKVSFGNGGYGGVWIALRRDGVLVDSIVHTLNGTYNSSCHISVVDTPTPGSHTYDLAQIVGIGSSILGSSLIALQL